MYVEAPQQEFFTPLFYPSLEGYFQGPQLTHQELPNRQRELEGKLDHLLKMDALPSFGTSTS